MGALTGLLYAGLVLYLGGWYVEKWSGDFSLLLFILATVTFFYWVAERFWFAPNRDKAALALEQQDHQRRQDLAQKGITQVDGDISAAKQALLAQPWWLDWTAGLFPVILVVFLLRSFLFEPFKIPSPSMVPTLRIGDFILVNKFHYGLRLPVINEKIIALNDPKPGDVMVFRFPPNPKDNYIKRVVGVPGDEVSYRNKLLYLNGKLVPTQPAEDFFDDNWLDTSEEKIYAKQFTEKIGDQEHHMLVDREHQSPIEPRLKFAFRDNCIYSAEGVTCKVPAGHYFMMGDNRDHSEDSRFWGFVPDKNIVGKAFFIWMNFSNIKRFGPFN
jgi:signal peptidase I